MDNIYNNDSSFLDYLYSDDFRDEMEDRRLSAETIVDLFRKGKAHNMDFDLEVQNAHLQPQDVKALEEVSKINNDTQRSNEVSKFTVQVFIRKKFRRQEPDLKRMVYEILKNKINPTHRNIRELMKSLNIQKKKLHNKVYYFFQQLRGLKYSDILAEEIIEEYEKTRVKPILPPISSTGERVDKPVVDEPNRIPINTMSVLKECRDHFAELNKMINSEYNYRIVVSDLINKKIIPSSEEGMKIISENGLNQETIEEYFNLLNRITVALSIDKNEKEIETFIRGLSDTEFEFIADLESEGLTLNDPEGLQMLSERCVNKSHIEKFFMLIGAAKIRDNAELFSDKGKKLQELFNSLNQYEQALIEDMMAEGLTPKDDDGLQMISERCVNKDNIINYFKLRDDLDIDIDDAKTMADTPVLESPAPVASSPSEPASDPVAPEPTEPVVEEAPIIEENRNDSINPNSVIDEMGTLSETRRNPRALYGRNFFSRVQEFFGDLFRKQNYDNMYLRENDPRLR